MENSHEHLQRQTYTCTISIVICICEDVQYAKPQCNAACSPPRTEQQPFQPFSKDMHALRSIHQTQDPQNSQNHRFQQCRLPPPPASKQGVQPEQSAITTFTHADIIDQRSICLPYGCVCAIAKLGHRIECDARIHLSGQRNTQ